MDTYRYFIDYGLLFRYSEDTGAIDVRIATDPDVWTSSEFETLDALLQAGVQETEYDVPG